MTDSTIVLCECGCGQPAPIADRSEAKRGYVRGQPRRFVHGHSTPRPPLRIDPDQVEVVDRGYETPCWIWLGRFNKTTGYAVFGATLIHRLSYTQFKGPIPPGLEIDHLCRNRGCVNPEHLEAVTHRENVRRGALGKALTADQARAIYKDTRKGVEVAAEYGVTPTVVSRIRNRKIWIRATEALRDDPQTRRRT